MVIYLQASTRVVNRADANADTVFINWRSIMHTINSQPKFAELDPQRALEVKFLAKNIRAKSGSLLSTRNNGISAAEVRLLFAFIRPFNDAKGSGRMADVNVVVTSHLHIHIDSHMPPFCSIAIHFRKQRVELGRFTRATRTARRDL